jgi:hypothetical protein
VTLDGGLSTRQRAVSTNSFEWAVDIEGLRKDFGYDLTEDGVDLADDQAVIRAAWENGVREPYFERQEDDEECPYVV